LNPKPQTPNPRNPLFNPKKLFFITPTLTDLSGCDVKLSSDSDLRDPLLCSCVALVIMGALERLYPQRPDAEVMAEAEAAQLEAETRAAAAQ